MATPAARVGGRAGFFFLGAPARGRTRRRAAALRLRPNAPAKRCGWRGPGRALRPGGLVRVRGRSAGRRRATGSEGLAPVRARAAVAFALRPATLRFFVAHTQRPSLLFPQSQSGAGATTVTTPAGPSTVVGGWAPPGALDAAAAHAAALHAHAAAAAAAHAGGVHLGAPPPDALYAGAGFMDDLLGGVPLVPPHGNGGAHAPPPPPPPFGDRAPSPPPLPPGEDGRPMHLLFDFDLFTASHGGGAPPPPPPAASPPAVRASSAGDGGKPVHTVMSNATSSGGGLGPADAAAAAAAATGPCGGLGGGGMEDDGDDYIMQIMFGEPAAAVPRRVTAHLHTWESAEWHGGGGGGGGNGNGTASGDASPRDADRGPRHHAVHGVASPRGSLDALLGISGGGEARVSLHRLVPLSAATVAPPPPGAPGVPPAAAAAPPRPPPPQMAAAVGAGGLPDAAVLGWATPAVPPAATG